VKQGLVAFVVLVAVALPANGLAASFTYDRYGTFLRDGMKVFPIGLTLGPPVGGTTPTGADGLDAVTAAGVDVFRGGASGAAFTDAVLAEAEALDQAAAARGAYTWINLRELARAQPGTPEATRLDTVVTRLRDDPGFGLWKGADEPWWSGWAPSTLQYAYCHVTGRGSASWCNRAQALDPAHLWVTIQAPRGTATNLRPYAPVTDTHGVNVYPVTLAAGASPDLHQVGTWTRTLASVTPNRNVWTTLQICASGSYDASGHFVLPTRTQERYMIYDAIVNGARAVNFFGGRNDACFNAADAQSGWGWTFWDTVLAGLVREIGRGSAIYPALLAPGSTFPAFSGDSQTQVATRRVGSDLWVIAARYGTGTKKVTIGGLPTTAKTATVYAEGRTVSIANRSIADTFPRWGVHVYRFKP
jgi:hypothetical protein